MNKKTITLSLATLMLVGATSCEKNCDTPVLPQSKIQVENSYRILRAYPADEIPSTGLVDLADVTEIADNVFAEAKSLKQITGLKLQKIGANAFKGSSLKTLVLDKTVPTTADDAFAGTSEDKELKVDASAVSSFYAFAHKHGFKTVNGQTLPQIMIEKGVLTSYPDYLLAEKMTLDNTVTSIAASVFAEKTIIKEVHAPSVKKIEAGAFKGATSLKTVELGAEIPDVAADAFEGTSRDKDLIVPEGAREKYKEFAFNHGFKTINGTDAYPIPAGVQIEGTELVRVTGDFRGPSLELPPSVTKIRSNAAQSKSSIKSIIGLGIVEIGDNALKYNKELTEVNFPKLKKIGRTAFEKCESLRTVTAPLVEEIGLGGFKYCNSLVEVNFPKLKTIPQGVFSAHGKLERIILSGVTSIEDQAFANQTNIKSIEFGTVPPTLSAQAFVDGLKSSNVTLYVPADAVSTYKSSNDKWIKAFTVEAKK